MDRRQIKSREAIFNAFSTLLTQKKLNDITVQDIIDLANVGRATFYTHFETKDYLLKQLCEELFEHVVEQNNTSNKSHIHFLNCKDNNPIFLHLIHHINNNDNNVASLLKSQNNEIFISYFKNCLIDLIKSQIDVICVDIPTDFLYKHISSTFVEIIYWWLQNNKYLSPDKLNEIFIKTISNLVILKK